MESVLLELDFMPYGKTKRSSTGFVDLRQDAEALLDSFNRHHRRDIRRANNFKSTFIRSAQNTNAELRIELYIKCNLIGAFQ